MPSLREPSALRSVATTKPSFVGWAFMPSALRPLALRSVAPPELGMNAQPSAPGMGADLEVQVLSKASDGDRSEAQLREGDRAWGGSV